MSAIIEDKKRTPLTNEQRKAIVDEARSWIRTPYHHLGDVKGAGVDCAMILVRVYCDLGIAPKFDPRPYAPQWFLHRSEEIYVDWLKNYCDQIQPGEEQPGDIALFRIGRCAAHGAIIVDDNLMIHSYQPVEEVCLMERRTMAEKLDSYWAPRNLT